MRPGRPKKPYNTSLAQPIRNKPVLLGSPQELPDSSVSIIDGKMRISAFLIIDENGGLTVRKNKPSLTGGQVTVRLEVELPEDYFYKSVPVAKLTLTDEHIIQPEVMVIAKHVMGKL